ARAPKYFLRARQKSDSARCSVWESVIGHCVLQASMKQIRHFHKHRGAFVSRRNGANWGFARPGLMLMRMKWRFLAIFGKKMEIMLDNGNFRVIFRRDLSIFPLKLRA
ncbi:MAG: hypothetical protein MPK01_03280, partial [Gammaproteobacteria bacterium]|nr:hypothetical protein [Gammaproteobacteria bacterium]